MFYIVIFLTAGIAIIILFRRFLSNRLDSIRANFHILRKHAEESKDKLSQLINKNKTLEEEFQKKLALYEMTKLISKSLDTKEVFSIFKDNIAQFIECKNCKFIETESDGRQTTDVEYFPLRTQERLIGNIVVEGLNPDDRDTMTILANQLNLVLRKASLFNEVQRLGMSDSLTQVFNRRYLLHRFNQEFRRALRYNMDISAIMIDVDLFKECNDKFGHLAGDVVLREVANLITQNIRNIDFLGRYGGEEFLVVLPSASKESSYVVAKRIHAALENHAVYVYDEAIEVTLSLGVASLSPDITKAQELLDHSDFALYRAKKTGRNRVCVYGVYD